MSVRPLLATVLLAAGLSAAPPARATSVCLENNTLTFSPALTLTPQIGTVTLRYDNTCADLPGLTPGQNSGTVTIGYFGTCALTIFTDGPASVMVGGVVHVLVRDNFLKIQLLQPTSLCPGPLETAHGTGVIVGA